MINTTRFSSNKHVTIIGAGIVGVTTAFKLVQAGCKVTVLDKQKGPSLGCSFSNGSLFCPGLIQVAANY